MAVWCVDARQIPCDAGKWSGDSGRGVPCSAQCDAGYVCRAGSRSSRPQVCGGAHVYCPLGSAAPLPVGVGFLSTGSADVLTRPDRAPCPPPSANAGVAVFCDGSGRSQVCPGGTFGNSSQLPSAACSGSCAAGYFCPEGSSTPTAHDCGGVERYCPAGSSAAMSLPLGHYSEPENDDVMHRASKRLCEPGRYCVAGWRYNCSGGTIAYDIGRQVPCTELCPEGYFCPNGTGGVTRDISCALPTTYCPRGSSRPFSTPSGHYAISLAGTRGPFSAVAPCDAGSFCAGGVRALCPAGRFGNTSQMNSSLCSGSCEAGYLCVDGSVNATRERCGRAEVYCPAGTPERLPVADGHYSAPLSAPPELRSEQLPCEPGYFCVQGVRYPCPAGRFGSDARLTDDTCTGPCTAGYFCGSGAMVPNETACGSAAVYCPEGSGGPLRVPDGEYSAGVSLETGNRSVACPPGSYCEQGVRRDCPAGTFGCSIRLSTRQCSGNCSAGYFCTAGATSNVEQACGADHDEHPREVYCPSGVGEPAWVDIGHFSLGGTSADRMTAQAVCPLGSYCLHGERVRRG